MLGRSTITQSSIVFLGALVAATLFMPSGLGAAETPPVDCPVGSDKGERATAIVVTIDPRVELVSIAQHLSGYTKHPRYQGRINEFDHPYIQAMKEHFAAFKDHSGLERLAKLRIGGSEPTNIAVHMSEPNSVILPDYTDKAGLLAENAAEYVACLREFAEASQFMEFFKSTAASRATIVDDFKKCVDLGAIARDVEHYCGTQPAGYTIILGPLMGRTAFGPNAVGEDGRRVFYAIFPPANAADGRLSFGDAQIVSSGVCHEFCHSFINSLVDQHWERLSRSAPLMQRVKYAPSTNYGDEWRICVYEHIVRAVTARIMRQQQGEVAYSRLIARDKARGFPFVDDLCRSLEVYEQSRSTYPNLNSYLDQLSAVFERLAASPAPPAAPQPAGT